MDANEEGMSSGHALMFDATQSIDTAVPLKIKAQIPDWLQLKLIRSSHKASFISRAQSGQDAVGGAPNRPTPGVTVGGSTNILQRTPSLRRSTISEGHLQKAPQRSLSAEAVRKGSLCGPAAGTWTGKTLLDRLKVEAAERAGSTGSRRSLTSSPIASSASTSLRDSPSKASVQDSVGSPGVRRMRNILLDVGAPAGSDDAGLQGLYDLLSPAPGSSSPALGTGRGEGRKAGSLSLLYRDAVPLFEEMKNFPSRRKVPMTRKSASFDMGSLPSEGHRFQGLYERT